MRVSSQSGVKREGDVRLCEALSAYETTTESEHLARSPARIHLESAFSYNPSINKDLHPLGFSVRIAPLNSARTIRAAALSSW